MKNRKKERKKDDPHGSGLIKTYDQTLIVVICVRFYFPLKKGVICTSKLIDNRLPSIPAIWYKLNKQTRGSSD